MDQYSSYTIEKNKTIFTKNLTTNIDPFVFLLTS